MRFHLRNPTKMEEMENYGKLLIEIWTSVIICPFHDHDTTPPDVTDVYRCHIPGAEAIPYHPGTMIRSGKPCAGFRSSPFI